MDLRSYRVKPGNQIDLTAADPSDTGGFKGGKREAEDRLAELKQELDRLQEVLYAEHKHRLLVVFQAMDTGGKDGAIRGVFSGVNPQGVRVSSFKVPTPEEADRDFLWRIHRQVPGRGEIVIFNRSHYEDVLVVRVHKLVPEAVWRPRYGHINDFERMLAGEGVTILKFFLHISKDEQKERLQARLDDPNKHWKFQPGDLDERKRWDEYTRAYEEALQQTSTAWAPWTVVPANRKWYRDLVVANAVVDALKGLEMQYPQPQMDLSHLVIDS